MQHKANSHSLKQGDSSWVFSVTPEEWNHVTVVNDDGDQHEDGYKCCETRRWDFEMRTHASIQGGALFDE